MKHKRVIQLNLLLFTSLTTFLSSLPQSFQVYPLKYCSLFLIMSPFFSFLRVAIFSPCFLMPFFYHPFIFVEFDPSLLSRRAASLFTYISSSHVYSHFFLLSPLPLFYFSHFSSFLPFLSNLVLLPNLSAFLSPLALPMLPLSPSFPFYVSLLISRTSLSLDVLAPRSSSYSLLALKFLIILLHCLTRFLYSCQIFTLYVKTSRN